MKQSAFLFFSLLFATSIFAQGELPLIHQTIVAKSYEMRIFDPVFLDLDQDQQVMADEIAKLLIQREESHIIARSLDRVAKATGLEPIRILRWAVREASIITLGLDRVVEARTWDYSILLKTRAANDIRTANQVKNYFPHGKSVMSSIE